MASMPSAVVYGLIFRLPLFLPASEIESVSRRRLTSVTVIGVGGEYPGGGSFGCGALSKSAPLIGRAVVLGV